MKLKINTVALYSSKKDTKILDIAKQCSEVLRNQGIKVLLTESLSALKASNIKIIKRDSILAKNSDLLISIGGDGTLLSCARRFGSKGVPILGINLGNLGFLADLAPDDITSNLSAIIKGNYISDKRFFLEANISKNSKKYIAVNEMVIHSGSIAKLMEFELYIDKSFVYKQRADGLIINSPTGSTAYSLSGRGPIVHPSVQAITLLPMFPHSLSASPLVVSDKSIIRIKVIDNRGSPILSMDGQNELRLNRGDSIVIKKAKSSLTLVHPNDHDFYSSCRNKLGWSSGLPGTLYKSEDL